ncbi:hypothetical protein M2318_002707 [Metapseudomonas resinovorans]|uniref:hypothetical protein n=1 Tax=Metapseudomonas resinovorans TaxID=53412 RepID=UPI003D194F26
MEDLYISTIRYAIQKDDQFSLGELKFDLGLSEEQFEMLKDEVWKGNILSHTSSDFVFQASALEVPVWASALDRFRLIEFEELQDARKAALGANRHAILAMVISAGLALASIALTFKEMSDSDKDIKASLQRLDKIHSTIEMVEARAALHASPMSERPPHQVAESSLAPVE